MEVDLPVHSLRTDPPLVVLAVLERTDTIALKIQHTLVFERFDAVAIVGFVFDFLQSNDQNTIKL